MVGVNFPQSLEELDLGYSFNQSLVGVNFPQSLEYLKLGRSFNKSLVGVNFPQSLTVIDLGYSFIQSLEGVNFPESLHRIIFNGARINMQQVHQMQQVRQIQQGRQIKFKTLSREVIDRLIADEECSVCSENYTIENPPVQPYICKHSYHKGCIEQWCNGLGRKGEECTCPMCRKNIY